MSATLPKFCFTCREVTTHDFVGAVGGRHLYKCATAGCTAAAREITPRELMTSASQIPPPKPRPERPRPAIAFADSPGTRKARADLKKYKYTNRRPQPMAESKEKKSPLILAIENIVAGATAPLIKRIEDLEGRSIIGEVNDAVEKALASALSGAASADGEPSSCRHKNRMKRCPSCQAKAEAAA